MLQALPGNPLACPLTCPLAWQPTHRAAQNAATQLPCPCLPAAVATIFLAVFSLLDDRHRLRSERLRPRADSAKGAVAWLGAELRQVCWGVGLDEG